MSSNISLTPVLICFSRLHRSLLLVAGVVLSISSFGQSQKGFSGSAEIGTYQGSSSRLPFWLRSGTYGTVPLGKPYAIGDVALTYHSQPDSASPSRIRWGGGVEGVFNLGETKQALVPVAYGSARWKQMEFWVGRRKEILGIVDTTLSSGSFTWSGNALPMPKIQIGLSEYLPLRFLKNYVSVKGFFAHGWYNTPYIQGSYLHQKAIHVRLGKPSGRFQFEAGINHHVTWGGHAEYLKTSPNAVDGRLTNAFGDYIWGVVLARVSKEFNNNRFNNFDGENRVGNHVGQYDFAVTYHSSFGRLMFYNNHPFEDASGFLFQNMPDGLYGLSWRPTKSSSTVIQLKGLAVEFITSRDQSGAGWNVVGSRFKGNDNYFNHQQYIQGWSYFGRALGTPLIPPKSEMDPAITGVREFFPANRVTGFHIGAEGTLLKDINWLSKVTYSHNAGTNNIVYDPTLRQFSFLLAADGPILRKHKTNTRLVAKLAVDRGSIFVNAVAGYVGVRSSGWFR